MRNAYTTLGLVLLLGCLEGSGLLYRAEGAEKGIAGLDQAIRDLECDNVVMCLAVRPEAVDADTLTYLRKNRGARTIVVVASWGENCGGSDECAGLSGLPPVDRAREVVSAADGMGWEVYSLTGLETEFDRDAATRRLVHLIREIQPDTILTRHSKDQGCALGRGMRAVGEECFYLAAEVAAFPEQIEKGLHPWQVSRFFDRTRCRSNPTGEYDASIPVGEYDAIRGMTYSEIAATNWPWCGGCAQTPEGSADDGQAYYRLVASVPPSGEVSDLLPDREAAALLQECFRGWTARRSIRRWERAVARLQEVSRQDRDRLLAGLRNADRGLWDLQRLEEKQPEAASCVIRRGVSLSSLRSELSRAVAELLGFETRITQCPANVWPESEFEVGVSAGFQWGGPIYAVEVDPALPKGVEFVSVTAAEEFLAKHEREPGGEDWVRPMVQLEELSPGTGVKATYRFRISPEAQLDDPTRNLLDGGRDGFFPVLTMFRLDPKRGLTHHLGEAAPVRPVPQVTVEAVPETPVFLYGKDRKIMIQVRVTNYTDRLYPRALVALQGPEGFTISQQELPRVTLLPFETASVAFWVRPESAGPGVHVFRAVVIYGLEEGQTYREADPEQLPHVLVERAVTLVAVEQPGDIKVGVIRTCDDILEDALESLEVSYSMLEADELAAADLGQWDVIIVDAGAYSKRPDALRHYKRLLRYMWRGGNVVVMGHHPERWDPRYAPYPIELTMQAIEGEGSKVAFLAPDHPLVQMPNQLEASDFEGWEGPWGRFFPCSWHDAYTSLLSVEAAGLPEGFAGGYLVANYGYGTYIYTGYDWERQLKAGHAGAYRAFANMIAYPKYREVETGEEVSPTVEEATE